MSHRRQGARRAHGSKAVRNGAAATVAVSPEAPVTHEALPAKHTPGVDANAFEISQPAELSGRGNAARVEMSHADDCSASAKDVIDTHKALIGLLDLVIKIATGVFAIAGILGIREFLRLSRARKEVEQFRSEFAVAKGNVDRLQKDLETVIDTEMMIHYVKLKDYPAIIGMARAILKDDKVDLRMRGRALYSLAWAYKRVHRLQSAYEMAIEAASVFQQIKEKHPVSSIELEVRALYNSACYASLLGLFKESSKHLAAALALQPSWATDAETEEDFEEFRAREPDRFRATLDMAKTNTVEPPFGGSTGA